MKREPKTDYYKGPSTKGRKLIRRAADALEPDGDEGRDNLR